MEEVKENIEKENTENKENAGNVGKPASKHWAIIGIAAAVLIVLAGAMMFVFGGSSAEKLQKQLDLGQKYLEEMNYEEAVVAFQAAIEIDPMSVDAYLGLVEVYIRTGDFDTALEYAKKGYEATGDERLKEKIDMIESEKKAAELQKQLDLGQKYLEEMNYEAAAAAFEAAIGIDPMSVDAYLGIVEAYIQMGDFDTALEYAKKGYEATGDERLKEKIDMIESGNITASNGWMVRASRYAKDGTLMWYYEYEYDSEGNMIAEREYYGDELGEEIKYEYEYDSEGNMIAKRGYAGDGILWRYEEYDSEGNIIVGGQYGGDGTLMWYREYEYNSEGNMIAEREYGGDGTLMSYYEYEYDSEGNKIAYRSYLSDGTLIGYGENEYDSEGNMIADRWYLSDDLGSYSEYKYDSEGNMIAMGRYRGDGALIIYLEYEYDSEGNKIAEKQYNESGNLIEEVRYEKFSIN